MTEDGSTHLCAFCHALLTAQWNVYETEQKVAPSQRQYNIHNFICAVCSVQTYRRRVMALPIIEFPFLGITRHSGSVTLENKLAVVCLDCSETLRVQSAEYDKMGLPVHKRQFNWMARPPPPEDSLESTVARLPSGETKLPICSLTRPAVISPQMIENTKFLSSEPPKHLRTQNNKESKTRESRAWYKAPRHSRTTSVPVLPNATGDMGDLRCQHDRGQHTPLFNLACFSAIETNPPNVDLSRKTVQTPCTSHPTLDLLRCECKSCTAGLSDGPCCPQACPKFPVETVLTAKRPLDSNFYAVTRESVQVSCQNARKRSIESQRRTANKTTSTAASSEKSVDEVNRHIPKKRNWQVFIKSSHSQILVSPAKHDRLQSPIQLHHLDAADSRHPETEVSLFFDKLHDGDFIGSCELPYSSNAVVYSQSAENCGKHVIFQANVENGEEHQAERVLFRPSVIKWAPKINSF